MTDEIKTLEEIAEEVRPIAGYPLTLVYALYQLGGRASASEVKFILGISLPSIRKHAETAMLFGYVKRTENYHSPDYFLTDKALQLSFPNMAELQDINQSEKVLHIPYSSSIKDSSLKTLKDLNTTTIQSEKLFQINDGFEVSWEADQLLEQLGIWKNVRVEIAQKFNNDIKEIARWFPPDQDLRLSIWKMRQGIAPEVEKIKDVCPECKESKYYYGGVCYVCHGKG